jgi:tetratricopeptide (TPR) repeat protein
MAGYVYALTQQGRWTEAFQYGGRVLPLFDRVGCSTCFMYIFLFLAEIEARRGHSEQSRNHIQSAMNIILQLDLAPLMSMRWRFLGHVFLEEWEQAWAIVEEARAGGHPDIGTAAVSQQIWSWHLPEVAARVGRNSEAEHIANDTMALFQEAGIPSGTASSHLARGLANAGQGMLDEAISEFELALAAHQAFGHAWDLANAQYELGKVCAAQGDLDRAKELLQEALTSFQALQARPGEEKVEMALRSLA